MDEQQIGAAVEERRKQIALTQDEVATLAGVHRLTIAALEGGGGGRTATLKTLLAAAGVLGLEVVVRPMDD
jgi:transcriptional regulator with XRE-family HTH domain